MRLTTDLHLDETAWTPADDAFRRPFVDVDEERTEPVPHRYVHGGFEGNDTRFSYYFPPQDHYEGRFFQHVTPVPQSENLAPQAHGEEAKIELAVESGAYFVETNGGGQAAPTPGASTDPSIAAYRANAAAAELSRVIAARLYGQHRPFGYLYGGSGGGYRTIGAAENTAGVWDGFVPYVIGTPMTIPSAFSVRMHAQRVLRDVFDEIDAAHDAGGDPSELRLSSEQAAAFDEVSRMGFPPRSWFGWRTMGMHAFSVLYPGMMAADPTYAEDFWTQEGYLGADAQSSVHRDRVQHRTQINGFAAATCSTDEFGSGGGVDESFAHVAEPTSKITGLVLREKPDGWLLGADLHVLTGASAGAVLRLSGVDGDTAHFAPGQPAAVLRGLAAGDEIVLDNSSFLAAQTYHRHQVPDRTYPAWDQFRHADGTPSFPQRPMLLGPLFAMRAAGAIPTGQVDTKMIVVSCLLDREAFPWYADWYRQRVAEHVGPGADAQFRLWYVDHALHGDQEEQEFPTRTVSYLGVLHTALRQLAAWVEQNVPPARSTTYTIRDGQVLVPDSAEERGGVQPVPRLAVNGGTSASVRVGERVTVRLTARTPEHAGLIIAAALDLSGDGRLGPDLPVPVTNDLDMSERTTFSQPGTYLLTARVTAQTQGDPSAVFGRVHNLARARVTVVP